MPISVVDHFHRKIPSFFRQFWGWKTFNVSPCSWLLVLLIRRTCCFVFPFSTTLAGCRLWQLKYRLSRCPYYLVSQMSRNFSSHLTLECRFGIWSLHGMETSAWFQWHLTFSPCCVLPLRITKYSVKVSSILVGGESQAERKWSALAHLPLWTTARATSSAGWAECRSLLLPCPWTWLLPFDLEASSASDWHDDPKPCRLPFSKGELWGTWSRGWIRQPARAGSVISAGALSQLTTSQGWPFFNKLRAAFL